MPKLEALHEHAMRNLRQDVADALDHASEAISFSRNPEKETICFLAKYKPRVLLRAILNYDDYSSWGEYQAGHLSEGFDQEEWHSELSHFRGEEWAERALNWNSPEDVPAIIIVVSEMMSGIADGRGRTNYAMARGWKHLPVILLTETRGKNFDVCMNPDRSVTWGS
jgi:hypothetical protein